jgi:phosphoadenosine phosphosulfate reductase
MIDLWGNVDPHIQHSIELLQEHEPPEGYYLAFSGGKDSIVCYDLCKKAGVKFDAHYMRAMEPPELVYFIRKHYPEVQRHLPKKTMWQLIVYNGIPPMRGGLSYCCREMKEFGGIGRLVVVGVRKQESLKRKSYQEYDVKKVKKNQIKIMIAPILNWTTDQVWQYIKHNKLSYPILYDQGYKRVGCILCPNSGSKTMQLDAIKHPKIADAYKRACVRAWDKKINPDWPTGEAMYEWWISGKSMGKDDGQGELEW